MSTAVENIGSTSTFTIEHAFGGYIVVRDGVTLTTRDGSTRIFKTRNSARKRIARERSGNLHR